MAPKYIDKESLRVSRRSLLTTFGIGAVSLLAGCTGSDDDTNGESPSEDGTTSDETENTDDEDASDETKSTDGEDTSDENGATDEETKEWREFDRPDNWPDHPQFIPNPTVTGPGGDVSMALEYQMVEMADSSYETFTLDLQELVLHDDGGNETTVTIDRTVDFYDYELNSTLLVVFDAAIPSGTYTEVELKQEAVEISHSTEGVVTDEFSSGRSLTIDTFGTDDELEIQSNSQIILMGKYRADDPPHNMLRSDPALNSFEPSFDSTEPYNFVNYRFD